MRQWLMDKRKVANRTQQQIADAVRIERSYYTQIELGYRRPSPNVAKLIGEELKFEWTIFFEDECGESAH